MKKTSRIATALLLASGLSVAAAPAAFAESGQCVGMKHSAMIKKGHHGHHGAHGGHFHGGPGFFKGLDLTEEQKDQLAAIRQELEPQRKHFQEIGKLRRQQHELVRAETFDAGKMQKLVEQETKLIAEQRLQLAQTQHKMFQVLTEEQRQQLDERREQRREKRKQQ